MTELSVFLAQNKVKDNNLKIVASKCFVDEKKKPVAWEVRKITAEEDAQCRRDATKKVLVNPKTGQYKDETDLDLYIAKLCALATVFPNLNNAELQDSYGVKTPESLLREMLGAGEYVDYSQAVIAHNGFDVGMDELVDKAKN